MSWTLLLTLMAVVFFNRYVFLEPKTAVQLPAFALRMLKYAAPCLMVSICLPIVFFEQQQWKGVIANSYFYGAVFTAVLTALTRKLLISITLSLIFFYAITWFGNF